MTNLLTKTEIRDLAAHGYTLSDENPKGKIIEHLIVVCHGNREKHDSGYPFIKIFGCVEGKMVFLGYHDHWIAHVPTNTDALGKNVFRVMPWRTEKQWKVHDSFIGVSTLEIGSYLYNDSEFVDII